MIRKLLAAALLAGLFLVSGCNESGSGGSASSGDGATAASTPTSASPSAADNTKKVCADMDALGTEFAQKIVTLAARAIQELSAGDEAKAEKTIEELNAAIPEFAGKIEALGASATNAELKQILTSMAAEVRKADEETIEETVDAAEAKYKAICGE
jgi:hypothetical protein